MSINVPIVSEWNDRGLRKATSDLETFSTRINKRFQGLADAGRKIGVALGSLAVGGAIIGKQLVDAASDFEEATSKTAVVLGSAADEVQRFAAGAQSIGIASTDALEASANFAIFGKAAGLAGSDLATFSTDFVTLAADLASFNNTTPEDAIQAIGAALRGESEPMRRFGVLLNDATLKAAALSQGIYDGSGALTAQQKVLAAQQVIYEQTLDAQGDFERTSGGLANQQRILSARLANLRTELGMKLLPVFTRFAGFVMDRLYPAVDRFARYAVGRLRDAFDRVRPFLERVATIMRDQVGPIIERIVRFMDDNGDVVATFFGVLAGAATVAMIASLAAALSRLFTPVGLVIGAIAALAAAAVYAYQNWELFRNIVDAIGRFFRDTVPRYFRLGLTAIRESFDTVLPAVARAWSGFVDGLIAVGNFLIDRITTLWNTMLRHIYDMVVIQLKGIADIFRGGLEIIRGIIDVFAGLFTGNWSRMWSGITQIAQGALTMLGGLVAILTAPIVAIWNIVTGLMSNAWSLMWSGIIAAAGYARDILEAIFNRIRDIIVTIWDNTVGRIVSGVSSIVSAVQSAVSAVQNLSSLPIPSPGGILGGLGGIIGGGSRIIRNILPFADGGIVTAPTLGLVGEAGPEAIIPLDQLGGMGGQIIVNVQGSVVTERDLVEQIRVGLLRSQRSGRQLVA